eukprot:1158701-Pelagomonas_calceolata.AAC.4
MRMFRTILCLPLAPTCDLPVLLPCHHAGNHKCCQPCHAVEGPGANAGTVVQQQWGWGPTGWVSGAHHACMDGCLITQRERERGRERDTHHAWELGWDGFSRSTAYSVSLQRACD